MSEGIHQEWHDTPREQHNVPFDNSQSHSDAPSYLLTLIHLSEEHFEAGTAIAIAKPNPREGTVPSFSDRGLLRSLESPARGSRVISIGRLDRYAWRSRTEGIKDALEGAIKDRLGDTVSNSSPLSKVSASDALQARIKSSDQPSPPNPPSVSRSSGDKPTRPPTSEPQAASSSRPPETGKQGTHPETEKTFSPAGREQPHLNAENASSQDLPSSSRASDGEDRSEREKAPVDQPGSLHALASEVQHISDDDLSQLELIMKRALFALQDEEKYLIAKNRELETVEEEYIKQYYKNSKYGIYLNKKMEVLDKEIDESCEKIKVLKVKWEKADKNYK